MKERRRRWFCQDIEGDRHTKKIDWCHWLAPINVPHNVSNLIAEIVSISMKFSTILKKKKKECNITHLSLIFLISSDTSRPVTIASHWARILNSVSEQFQSSFRAVLLKFYWNLEQFQSNFRAVSEQFPSSYRAISDQFKSSLRAVFAEQFQISFRAVSE